MENLAWVIAAFFIYITIVFAIVLRYRRQKNLQGYLLGDRSLGPWKAAFSAQTSDMSSWILMGLPGAIYAVGTSNAWIAVGLLTGTLINWLFVAKKLRRYTIIANNSITLSAYFENRFRDTSHTLKIFTAIFFVIFFTIYVASFFVAMGNVISLIFGISYTTALIFGVIVVVAYTFIGGFLAVSTLDLFQGTLMLSALVFIPLLVIGHMGGWDNVYAAIPYGHWGMFTGAGGEPVAWTAVASGMAWGLGYFGMPHILARYMAIRRERDVPKAAVVGMCWISISLVSAVMVGMVGVAFIPGLARPETVFIEMVQGTFLSTAAIFPGLTLVGGILIVALIAAVKSTADSQMLVVSSAVSSDIYGDIIKKGKGEDKKLVLVSRFSVIAVALLSALFATNPGAGVMVLVAAAWAGLGSTFGPVILFSIFWKRVNFQGALAGMITGGVTVLTWLYLPLVSTPNGMITLNAATRLFSLLPGFVLASIVLVIVTLLTKEPSAEIQAEFEKAKIPLEEPQD